MRIAMQEWQKGDYVISTDNTRLDFPFVFNFLSQESYWAQERSEAVVQKSLEHSLNFGVYRQGEQVGFARVVSDYATFAWLADVFIVESHRGEGLGKWLIEIITAHPDLQNLRRWVLATRDAHELYSQYGFERLREPGRWMERRNS
jgi:GNAT superfamily N-acetyltransferase